MLQSDPFRKPLIRPVTPEDPIYRTALTKIFGTDRNERGGFEFDPVDGLLAKARCKSLSLDLVVGVEETGELREACASVASPGCSALVFVSPIANQKALDFIRTVEMLRILVSRARQKSIRLLEALLVSEDSIPCRVLEAAGFRHLTRLLYLRRQVRHVPSCKRESGFLEWRTLDSESEKLFQEALKRTYVQSLDCPELTGLRSIAEVMADHRAAGEFDPSLWWVASRGEDPLGVLLLSRLLGRPALEILYIGVSQFARGSGVGDALLERALHCAKQLSAKELTLAVDSRNTPARRLYSRWRFVQTMTREAWIATPLQE